MLPRTVEALASLVADRNPEVSLASTILLSDAAFVARVILSPASVAVTPAADELIRESTVLIVSFAFTAMLVPLIVNEPAVTCAPLSNFGRRLAFALLNVALASTFTAAWLTVVDPVWFCVRFPDENEIERPISAPR